MCAGSGVMRVLFIHQNFPGQFKHIAQHMAKQPGVEVLAIGRDSAPGLPGVRLLRYKPHRPANAYTHPYARTFEDAVLHGQEVLRLLLDLKRKGYRPDVIVAHPGWGETLYVKEAFPAAKLIHFCEFYYHSHGADANFDPEFPLGIDGAARIRSEEHTSELQSQSNLVCRLLLEKKHTEEGYSPPGFVSDVSTRSCRMAYQI